MLSAAAILAVRDYPQSYQPHELIMILVAVCPTDRRIAVAACFVHPAAAIFKVALTKRY